DWLVSPRAGVSEQAEYLEEERTKADLNDEGAPLSTEGWTRLDPQQVLGVVNLGNILFPEDSDLEEAGAYAYAVLAAPADGPADLGFASIVPGAQVWINGALAHTAVRQSQIRPGLERFRADLKAG